MKPGFLHVKAGFGYYEGTVLLNGLTLAPIMFTYNVSYMEYSDN